MSRKGQEVKRVYTNATDFGGRGTAAYNLGAFVPAEEKRRSVPTLEVVRPGKAQREQRRLRVRAGLILASIMGVALVITVLAAMLASRAILTELNVQIARTQKALTESISENTGLKTQLEAKLSMRTIEEYALQNLGMTPLDKSQITYVNLSGGNKIERHAHSESSVENVLMELVRQIRAYFLDG